MLHDRTISLPFGPCDVELNGDGPPLLLVHGVLVNGHVWDRIVGPLAVSNRVIQPHLPLGAHGQPATRRDLVHPEGIADALAVLLDELGVEDAVVMGNDSRGAISQIFTARHPDRVRALVLTSCDALDHFPPNVLKPVKPLLAIPGMVDVFGFAYRSRWVRRTWMGAGLVLNKPIDDSVIASFFDRIAGDRQVRRDMAAFIRRCKPSLTHAAADSLRSFPRPVLLAWSRNDPLFPERDAERLAAMIPGCELHWITDAKAFSMIDQPEQLLDIVTPFLVRVRAGELDVEGDRRGM